MPRHIELNSGDQFGSWTVVERGKTDSGGNVRWICKCQCGKVKSLLSFHLRKKAKTCRSCFMKGKPKLRGNQSPHWTGCGEISGKHWDSILRHAKDRGYAVEISIEDAWALFLTQKRQCALTGREIGFGESQTASLDRIDSTKDYVSGNIQWVHKKVNWMKGKLSDQELLDWCRAIVDHHISVSY